MGWHPNYSEISPKMNDFLSTFSDPVDEAKHLAQQGNHTKALVILTPLLQEIQAAGAEPTNTIKDLLESLTLKDAQIFGTT